MVIYQKRMCNPQAFNSFTEKYVRGGGMCIDVCFFLHRLKMFLILFIKYLKIFINKIPMALQCSVCEAYDFCWDFISVTLTSNITTLSHYDYSSTGGWQHAPFPSVWVSKINEKYTFKLYLFTLKCVYVNKCLGFKRLQTCMLNLLWRHVTWRTFCQGILLLFINNLKHVEFYVCWEAKKNIVKITNSYSLFLTDSLFNSYLCIFNSTLKNVWK